jgi:hypothetical protein
MEAADFSEAVAYLYQTRKRHNPEDHNLRETNDQSRTNHYRILHDIKNIKIDLTNLDGRVWTGLIWLRIGISSGLLWTFGFSRILGNS